MIDHIQQAAEACLLAVWAATDKALPEDRNMIGANVIEAHMRTLAEDGSYVRYLTLEQNLDERNAEIAALGNRVKELEDEIRDWKTLGRRRLEDLEAAEARAEKLKEYAQHSTDCDIMRTRDGYEADCTCGLEAALAETGEK